MKITTIFPILDTAGELRDQQSSITHHRLGYIEPYLTESDYWVAMPMRLTHNEEAGWALEIGPYALDRQDVHNLHEAMTIYQRARAARPDADGHHNGLAAPPREGADVSGRTPPLLAYSAGLEASADCVKLLRVDGSLLDINPAGRRALGIPLDDTELGMPWLDVLPNSVHNGALRALRDARTGSATRFAGCSIAPDGTIRDWDNMLTPIPDDSGQIRQILCISRDITGG